VERLEAELRPADEPDDKITVTLISDEDDPPDLPDRSARTGTPAAMAVEVQQRLSLMTSLQRRLRKIEVLLVDEVGLVAHSPKWLAYWTAWLDRVGQGEDPGDERIPPRSIRRGAIENTWNDEDDYAYADLRIDLFPAKVTGRP
jgi:hypothetical protein